MKAFLHGAISRGAKMVADPIIVLSNSVRLARFCSHCLGMAHSNDRHLGSLKGRAELGHDCW